MDRLWEAGKFDEKAVVLARYPEANAQELADPLAYHPWIILMWPDTPFVVGGGPSEAEAWHNAWVHIDTADRWKAKRAIQQEGDAVR